METLQAVCVILGGGGHAKVLIDALRVGGRTRIVAVLDADRARWGSELLGVPVLGGDDLLPEVKQRGATHFVVGLGSTGDNRPREHLFELALRASLEPLTVLHPAAICSSAAVLESGAQLLAGSIVVGLPETAEAARWTLAALATNARMPIAPIISARGTSRIRT